MGQVRLGRGGDARRTALSPVASVSSNERSPTLANFTAPTLGAIVVRQMPSAQWVSRTFSDRKYAEYAWGPCLRYRYVRPRIRFPATSSSSPARAAALFTPRALHSHPLQSNLLQSYASLNSSAALFCTYPLSYPKLEGLSLIDKSESNLE